MPETKPWDGLEETIYGIVLATALIAAYSEDPGSDPWQVAVAVMIAALIFWVAHAYADFLARGMRTTEGARLAHVRAELAREWPLVLGALAPVLPLLLAPLGALSDDNAETVAIATGVGLLGLVGVGSAWRRGSGLFGIAFSAVASALFGIVIVLLKALVH